MQIFYLKMVYDQIIFWSLVDRQIFGIKNVCHHFSICNRAGSGLFFPSRFGFRALIFDPVRFGQKLSLFGSPSGQNYFYSGQFCVQSLKGDLIFLN